MSRKQKSRKDDWNTCLNCRCLIHSRDTADHEEMCRKSQSQCHGFINNRVLNATVIRTATVKDLPDVPPAMKNNVVFIHPSAMFICGLCLGQPCIVGSCQVMCVWPWSNLHPASVALPASVCINVGEIGLKGETVTVTVEQFSWGLQTALQAEIELRSRHDAFLKEEFLQFLAHKMDGKFVKQGSTHSISYFGLSCAFCIRSVQSAPLNHCEVVYSPPSSLSGQGDGLDLSQTFSQLDISSVSDSGDVADIFSAFSGRDELSCSSLVDDSISLSSQTPERGGTSNEVTTTATECNQARQCVRHADHMNSSESFVKVTAETKFTVVRPDSEEERTNEQKVTFDCLGGLEQQIKTIKEIFHLHLHRPELSQLHGLRFSHGMLLYGPPGTGKTTLAQAVANEMPVHTVKISVTDVLSKFVGETERKLRALFKSASKKCPSLIIIDNFDGLCPRRDDSSSDLEKRVVATCLTLLDGLSAKSSGVVLVLGITNRPDSIDPALRRPGRIDCDIETGVPSAEERLQILQKLLHTVPHNITDVTLKDISDARHGFVGADLALLVRKATEQAVKRSCHGQTPVLTADDMLQALDAVSPSVMKEVMLEVPQVRWSDIGGQAEVKLKLQQAVEWQLKHPEVFTRFGISPPRGILLYGPPGCSKTMVAKALATESGLNFLAVKGPECFSKWVGESERALREVFCKARAAAPSIVFFDEIDALAVERGSGGSNVADRVLTQLLTEMDGVERMNGVCVVAATNRPDKLDQALLRPGRFDQILYVPLPDAATRREILQIEFRKKPVAADISVDELVNRTERYSGAEVTAVCNEAALAALQENIRSTEITRHHFDIALRTVKPGTSRERVKFYEDYSKQRQSGLRFV